ncbi:hypothetical protein B296_00030896, partial [Ensete ventricosum]
MEGNFGPVEQVLWPVSVFSGVIMCKVVILFLVGCKDPIVHLFLHAHVSSLSS